LTVVITVRRVKSDSCCGCRFLLCDAEGDSSSRPTLHQSSIYLFLCKHIPLGNSCMCSSLSLHVPCI